jgi:hypothetical protein
MISDRSELSKGRAWSAALLASLGSAFGCFELAQVEAQESSSFPTAWAIMTVVWALSAIASSLNAGAAFRAHIKSKR